MSTDNDCDYDPDSDTDSGISAAIFTQGRALRAWVIVPQTYCGAASFSNCSFVIGEE